MQREINLVIDKDIWIWRWFFALIYSGLAQMSFTLGFPRKYISVWIRSMSQEEALQEQNIWNLRNQEL